MGLFFFKLQIISILYALIKYNKIGSTFRKIYAQQIKQNKISTNSFLVMEKKIRKCLCCPKNSTIVLNRDAKKRIRKKKNLFTKAMIRVQFISK